MLSLTCFLQVIRGHFRRKFTKAYAKITAEATFWSHAADPVLAAGSARRLCVRASR
jgi:hypothetical protein